MPGANCSIFGYVSRIFKVPSGTNAFKSKWRRNLINVITKDRVVDQSLQKQIECNKLDICERHFSQDQLWIYDSKTSMKDGVIPTLNLPIKTICSPLPQPRSTSVIEKREESSFFSECLEQSKQSVWSLCMLFNLYRISKSCK